jgi:DNA-binding CsgD family transcriptional regulator
MEIVHITQLLLEAALDPQQWTAALSAIARYGGAKGAALLPIQGRLPQRALISPELEGALQDYFAQQWQIRDEREHALPKMRRTGIATDQDFVTEWQLKHSDYYNDYLTRHDINWSACVDIRSGGEEWALILERGNRLGHFELREQERILLLSPLVKQAATLSQQLAFAKVVGVADAFDLIGGACILINRFGKVFRANSSAEPYFRDGLSLSEKELSCILPSDTSALRRIIISLCDETDAKLLRTPRSMVVQRRSGRPFIVQAISLSGIVSEVFSPARVLLFIVDPFGDSASASADELRRAFGLTQAEALLVLKLKDDMPLAVVAEQIGITYQTARTHLKNIMHKTQTKRQAELLSIVQRMSVRILDR